MKLKDYEYYRTDLGEIYKGDVLEVLKLMPDESVHCCVTSPPYWGLRDYGVDGQLGLEKTPEEYVSKMVEIFSEVKRVLRDDGTLWLNLGDSYVGSWGDSGHRPDRTGTQGEQRQKNTEWFKRNGHPQTNKPVMVSPPGLKPKDLIGVPWRVAFALQADGWWLRSDIIWAKPNPMPESVTDRPTKAHEYLFLLTKSAKYYYDADAIREPHNSNGKVTPWNEKEYDQSMLHKKQVHGIKGRPKGIAGFSKGGRNKRTVWTIPTQPMPEAHFATFPKKLIEPCVLSGTSEKGCCVECGAPWERVVEKGELKDDPGRMNRNVKAVQFSTGENDYVEGGTLGKVRESKTTGWQPTCKCKLDYDMELMMPRFPEAVRCTVLDPFFGSGTTGIVAYKHNRKFIGIDLSETYLNDIAIPRINKATKQLKLF